jgi:hypothetical protein
MDEDSQARYAVLFANYGEVSTAPTVAASQAKRLILEFIDGSGPFLRADGALMLLSTYDNMIARPFTLGHHLVSADLERYISITNTQGLPGSIAGPSYRSEQIVDESLEDLRQILSWLYDLSSGTGRQVNAYDVITGIDQLWGKLHIAAFGKWDNPVN